MRILVLGAAGMLGHEMFLALQRAFPTREGHDVAGTLRKTISHYKRFQLTDSACKDLGRAPSSRELFADSTIFDELDLADFAAVLAVLEKFRPDCVVNCVGLTLRKPEVADTALCLTVNSLLPQRLAKWCAGHEAKLIHFSTDCVFDGKGGDYRETDIPMAPDLYGQSKFLGEVVAPHALTFRAPFVGRELEGKTELVEWFLAQNGTTIKGFDRVMYSGLTTGTLAREVVGILKNHPQLNGLYHLASEPISKYDLLSLVNEVYDVGVEIRRDSGYVSDKSLNCEAYQTLTGFKKPKWREMVVAMKNEEKVRYE